LAGGKGAAGASERRIIVASHDIEAVVLLLSQTILASNMLVSSEPSLL
jgi:hypothetical protein